MALVVSMSSSSHSSQLVTDFRDIKMLPVKKTLQFSLASDQITLMLRLKLYTNIKHKYTFQSISCIIPYLTMITHWAWYPCAPEKSSGCTWVLVWLAAADLSAPAPTGNWAVCSSLRWRQKACRHCSTRSGWACGRPPPRPSSNAQHGGVGPAQRGHKPPVKHFVCGGGEQTFLIKTSLNKVWSLKWRGKSASSLPSKQLL